MSDQMVLVKFKSRACRTKPGPLTQIKESLITLAIPPDAHVFLNHKPASLTDNAQAGDEVEFVCQPGSVQDALTQASLYEKVGQAYLPGFDPDLDP